MKRWYAPIAIVILATLLLILLMVPQSPDSSVGTPAPEFRLKDLQGNDFFSNKHQGRVMLVNFWATWCTFCIVEMPYLEKLRQQFPPEQLVIVSILQDPENIDQAFEIKSKNNLTFPVLTDTKGDVFRAYNIKSLPYTVIIGLDGKIRFVHLGFTPRDYDKYTKEITQLLD